MRRTVGLPMLPLAPLLAAALLAASCSGGTRPTASGPAPVEVETASGLRMVLVPGGTFAMGSDAGAPDEAPVHDVRVAGFAMDVYEVAQEEFARLEVPDPSQFKAPGHPVEQVRWSDAAEYCNLRSKAEGLEPCYDEATFACDFSKTGYRLPTEAEWEYAARAGGAVDRVFGFEGGAARLASHACYAANSGKSTAPVGRRRPNAWGLYDLSGNVSEWCHDVYSADYYAHSPQEDPRGPAEGKERVLRGGNWESDAASCRPTRRMHDVPGITDACFARNTYGFRCVRRLTAEEEARLGGASQR